MNSSAGGLDMTPAGFPHSGIHGSTPACGSPWLIAANHALLRLLTPRHPPSALSSLTTSLYLARFARRRAALYAVSSLRHRTPSLQTPRAALLVSAAASLLVGDRCPPAGSRPRFAFREMFLDFQTQRISHTYRIDTWIRFSRFVLLFSCQFSRWAWLDLN